MWRSNVLALRRCSSPAVRCSHGLAKRWYSSEKGEAIQEEEFLAALEKVYPRTKWRAHYKLGLAVSGGVDSMALATLYWKATSANEFLPKCHGFIIDHKVRPESTEEAEWVAQQMRFKFGMEASIIPLSWPEEYDMLDPRRFETDARKLRYQALGRACAEHRISSLMVAHHADDQAETVLMRLMNMRWRTGLTGMQGVEWIPENYGIHGVYHSGGIRSTAQEREKKLHIPYPVEKGGIQILRPLLAFEKSRLIATCEEQGTAWAEDKTNQIRTLTSRNAIRHIFKNYKMPEALSVQSLVNLSQRMQTRVESHKAHGQNLFDNCPIKQDIQTGSLIVRLPPVEALLDTPIVTDSDKNQARNSAFFLFERLAELVAPRERAPLSQLANAVVRIYPTLATSNEEKNFPNRNGFCVFGVWWRRSGQASPFEDGSSQAQPIEWLLSRQPLEEVEKKTEKTHIMIPPSSLTEPQWHLFDGRFWMRITNDSSHCVILRTLEDHEVDRLVARNIARARTQNLPADRYIRAALSLIKPADLRRHLPAIFLTEPDSDEQRLLALPTLDVTTTLLEPSVPKVSWEIHYKKCNLGRREVSEIVCPGISKDEVIAEERRLRMMETGTKRIRPYQRPVFGVADADVSDVFTGYKRVDVGANKENARRAWAKRAEGKRSGGSWRRDSRGMSADELEGLGEYLEENKEGKRKESVPLFEQPKQEVRNGLDWRDLQDRI